MISENTPRIAEDLVLGLDLGTNSLGWCLLSAPNGRPASILAVGARAFDAGMEGDISAGKGESPGVQRRAARATRRVLARRAQRLRKVLHTLQAAGLLPHGKAEDVLPPLDAAWLEERLSILPQHDPERHRQAHLLPYLLRKEALDRPLTRQELGRALYHLAQRRGFLTNRKAEPKKDEKPGEVAREIETLRGHMEKAHARTLGEYFAGLDPQKTRIRQRWTARGMYLLEFERIWGAQAPHHAEVLTDDLRRRYTIT